MHRQPNFVSSLHIIMIHEPVWDVHNVQGSKEAEEGPRIEALEKHDGGVQLLQFLQFEGEFYVV